MIKKTSLLLFLLCILSFISFNSKAESFFIEEDDIEYEPDDYADISQTSNVATRTIGPTEGIGIIALYNLQNFLKEPFYKYTHPPRRRPLTDQPYLQFPDYTHTNTINIIPIAHGSVEQHLVKQYSHLERYVDLEQRYFVEILSGLVGPVNPGPNFQPAVEDFPNIPEILSLFAPLKTQEWQLGFDFQYFRNFDGIFVFAQVPFIYQVDNYYLTAQERENIENYPLIKDFFGDGDYWDFVKNHLICDRIGWADAQVFIEATVKETYKSRTNVGLELLIPIACTLKKGLLGTSFDVKAGYPPFNMLDDFLSPGIDLQSDINPTFNQQLIIDNATNLGFEILDRLTTILLEQPIGMQHFVIGVFTRTQMIFTPWLDLTSKTGLSCSLPGNENRFMRHNLDEALALVDAITKAGNDGVSDEKAAELMAAFNTATLQHFFPLSYKTKVFPGFFFESYSQLTYHGQNWTFYAGSNTWWAFMNERFLKIDIAPTELPKLDTTIAKKDPAYQTRIFFGADKNPYYDSPWTFGLRAGCSSLSWNIGPDLSIAGFLRYEF